jgi:hypothetical protein
LFGIFTPGIKNFFVYIYADAAKVLTYSAIYLLSKKEGAYPQSGSQSGVPLCSDPFLLQNYKPT